MLAEDTIVGIPSTGGLIRPMHRGDGEDDCLGASFQNARDFAAE
jgi:hypothetical protein